MQRDRRDIPVTGADATAVDRFETALRQFQSYTGDPVGAIDEALRESPAFVAGHLLRAFVFYTLAERRFVPEAAASLANAELHAAAMNDRERGLARAAALLIDGDWHAACRTFDVVLTAWPRDALALQAAHLMDFARGDAQNLRNRVSRVLPHWSASVAGYSYVLGMHAFGLEEMNQYPEAEDTAMRALAIERHDGWAVHAATHVMEMQGRIGEGIALLESREVDWAPDNGFAYHNYWHLALFFMDGGRFDRALALFDRRIHPGPAAYLLALVDATALLWRLRLENVDVGTRFEGVADEWESVFDRECGFYAFNDFHAALSFAATGRRDSLARVAANLRDAAGGDGTNAAMSREVGVPLVDGVIAFGDGRYADAIAAIEPVRDIAHRFGGSHAQRDILTLTLIEAALRTGDAARARHYVAERLVHKPKSEWGHRLARRAETLGRH